VDKEVLKKPILYYNNLTRVREKDDLTQWFKFFLAGVIEIAKSTISTFDSILRLQKKVEFKVETLGSRSHNAQLILNHFF